METFQEYTARLREAMAQAIASCDGTTLADDQPTVYHKMADAVMEFAREWLKKERRK